MKRLVSDLKLHWQARPFVWSEEQPHPWGKVHLPSGGRVLALAPHPDDPESVAVTGRLLMRSGCDVHYAIVTMSPLGVEDAYARARHHDQALSLQEKKVEIRRREQIRSAEMFGLTPDRFSFLGLEEDDTATVADSSANRARIKDHLESLSPDIVMLPVGRDTNPTHAWVCQVLRDCASSLVQKAGKPLVALYNEDPKTTRIRNDLFVLFGDQGADWKGALLRAHDSQQQRNIHRRRHGFDERILEMNRLGYHRLPDYLRRDLPSEGFAEVFELELFDFS